MFPIRDNIPATRIPIVTGALLVANVVVFLHQVFLPPALLEQFVATFGVVPARLFRPIWAHRAGFPPGAILTLFTSMFLHGGWFHLIANMWALWLFGDNVEDRLGHARFALFYALCGVIAMLAHVLVHPGSQVPALGASGAIAGVMGAYLLFFPFARVTVLVPILFYPLFFQIPAVVFLLIWFLAQLSGGARSLSSGAAGIAFWAHIGGFLSGLYFARRWKRRRRSA